MSEMVCLHIGVGKDTPINRSKYRFCGSLHSRLIHAPQENNQNKDWDVDRTCDVNRIRLQRKQGAQVKKNKHART